MNETMYVEKHGYTILIAKNTKTKQKQKQNPLLIWGLSSFLPSFLPSRKSQPITAYDAERTLIVKLLSISQKLQSCYWGYKIPEKLIH
jgi:hypothetical protein